jgi:hypothetical protein
MPGYAMTNLIGNFRLAGSTMGVILIVLAGSSLAQSKRPAKPLPAVTIDGILLKSDGKPRQYMELQLVPVDSQNIVNDSRLIAATDIKGRFAFCDVPNGRYTLSVKFGDKPTELSPYSTFFYPSTENRKNADVFDISAGTKLLGLTFRLPPELVNRRMAGRVVWADDGTPVAGAWIGCIDIDFDFGINFGRHFSRADGTFNFDVYTGRRYQAAAIVVDVAPSAFPGWALVNVLAGGETPVFKLDTSTPAIEIKLRRAPESKESKNLIEKYVGVNRAARYPFS